MVARRVPPSISPNVLDPTTVSGRPKPRDGPSPPVELVVDGPVVQKVATVAVRPDDKVVFDALQSWWRLRYGEWPTQWELFTQVLSAALGDDAGPFAGASDVV